MTLKTYTTIMINRMTKEIYELTEFRRPCITSKDFKLWVEELFITQCYDGVDAEHMDMHLYYGTMEENVNLNNNPILTISGDVTVDGSSIIDHFTINGAEYRNCVIAE